MFIILALLLTAGIQTTQAQTEIRDWNDLTNVRTSLGGSFILANDIDEESEGYSTYNTGDGWEPLGSESSPFTGVFDGNDHTISGLKISRSTGDNGLFGYVDQATIKNLGVINAELNVQGEFNGVLVGRIFNSTMEYCYSTGTLTQTGPDTHHGGLIGRIHAGTLFGSWSSVTVQTEGRFAGGLTGTITSITDVGGATVEQSYATGNVVSDFRWIGGLAGQFGGTSIILDSYATGNVTGSSQVGGLVGYHWRGSEIYSSYSTGLVSGEEEIGGLIGHRDPPQGDVQGKVETSFWDTESSGTSQGVGFGETAGVNGRSTDQMKTESTFAGWNFSTVWAMDEELNDGYPVLMFQLPTSSEAGPQIPQDMALNQNYPNPFNPSTVISYSLNESRNVRLSVYDVTGRLISVLVDQQQAPGAYQVNWDAGQLSSGVYIYRLEAGNQILMRRMSLVK
ncbi:MAG: T9SS type A sorting domain-containing protein [Cyclonatronaceae bacterium]